jgi:hypothetical protein
MEKKLMKYSDFEADLQNDMANFEKMAWRIFIKYENYRFLLMRT